MESYIISYFFTIYRHGCYKETFRGCQQIGSVQQLRRTYLRDANIDKPTTVYREKRISCQNTALIFPIVYEYLWQGIYELQCPRSLALHSDAKRYGPLDDFSAFPFENYLQEVKRMVRKSSATLQQVVKRVEERNIFGDFMPFRNDITTLLEATKGKPVPKGFEHATQYKGVVRNGIRFTTENRDNCVIVQKCVARIVNIITVNEDIFIVYRRYLEASSFFSEPLDSAVLGIVKVTDLDNEMEVCPLNMCHRQVFHDETEQRAHSCMLPLQMNVVRISFFI